MKKIELYESTDGSRWASQEQAEKRDFLDACVRAIEDSLPSRPTDSDERIAVDKAVVLTAKAAVINLCRQEFPSESVFQHDPAKIHPMSFAGRLLSAVGGPLERVWSWFMCEHDGWLYQQPFFAMNPDKFQGKAQSK